MGDETMYPAQPGSKEKGATSERAGAKAAHRANTLRAAVLREFERHPLGLTADELATHLGETPFAIRPRVSELVKQELVIKTASRRRNTSGMSAAVHILAGQALPV